MHFAAGLAAGETCTSVANIGDVGHPEGKARQVAIVGTHDVLYVSTLACSRADVFAQLQAAQKAVLQLQLPICVIRYVAPQASALAKSNTGEACTPHENHYTALEFASARTNITDLPCQDWWQQT